MSDMGCYLIPKAIFFQCGEKTLHFSYFDILLVFFLDKFFSDMWCVFVCAVWAITRGAVIFLPILAHWKSVGWFVQMSPIQHSWQRWMDEHWEMLKFQGFLTFGLLLLSGCHCSLVVAASSEKISLFSKCKDRLALKCMLSKKAGSRLLCLFPRLNESLQQNRL